MSIASLLSIKVTSPITHMISSAVRGVAGSLLAMELFKEIITTLVHESFFFFFLRNSLTVVVHPQSLLSSLVQSFTHG